MINLSNKAWTKTFNEVWEEEGDFLSDSNLYYGLGLDPQFSNAKTTSLIYYLLSAQYGNSPISNFDVNQFKLQVFRLIFQYGPTWEKSLDIQSKLRALKDEELFSGNTNINNHSYNPGTKPTTATLDELPTIDDQYVTKQKKSKLEAYAGLMALLEKDVTEDFIKKFGRLFNRVVSPQLPLYYANELSQADGRYLQGDYLQED